MIFLYFFFFKQKTAYEMRISDWSSDVCSSDLMVGLTRSWALELAAQGITVNCVAPGPVATEMFKRNNPSQLARSQALLNTIPVMRIGTPVEIAHAVDSFLSPYAGYTTGQTLFVCGGASIHQVNM